MNVVQLQDSAAEAAREAGALLRELWQKPRLIEIKGFRDFVTDADYASQRLIVARLQAQHPEHGFLTEESEDGQEMPAFGPVRWVIDPVDGTNNFSRQHPNFAISIGAVDPDDRPLAGAVYDPIRDELFTAAKGAGSWLNGQRLTVSPITEPAQAVLALDWSRHPTTRQAVLNSLGRLAPQVHTIRALGSAALALAYVAAGRLDAYINFGLFAWDTAAGALLVQEAGGHITSLLGAPWQLKDNGAVVSNGHLHNTVRAGLDLSWLDSGL